MNRARPYVIPLFALLASAGAVSALINPDFTPIHLVQESGWIAAVELAAGEKPNTYAAKVKEALKGDDARKSLKLDFSAAINKETAKAVADLAQQAAGQPALFFIGEFADGEAGGGDEAPAAKAFLHVGGKWAEFAAGADQSTWSLLQISSHMEGTWAGGSDMLLRAVKYALADDTADFPVKAGAQWDELDLLGKTGAAAVRLMPVSPEADGRWSLFALCPDGDRLYEFDAAAKKMSDVTGARKLQSKSRLAAWGDFTGDGRIDLVSLDGESLALQARQHDGTYAARPVKLSEPLGKAVGLTAMDTGEKTGAAILVARDGAAPLVVRNSGAEAAECAALPDGVAADLGPAGECLLADFDGDSLPDVLQVFSRGSRFYVGKAAGEWATPAACDVASAAVPLRACTGDFDADGRLDVLTVSSDGVRIWQNQGKAVFRDFVHRSGEIAYISKPDAVDCATGDVNNDGRQDVLIAYNNIGAHVFFNRGFRSFGHAHDLDMTENRLLEEGQQGQTACCLADFNGDGAQDMALALPGGEIWLFPRLTEGDALNASVSLSPAASVRGPVTVTGACGNRSLGAWNVAPGTADAFFGVLDPGPVGVRWRLPGGQERKKDLVVEAKPVRLAIE